MGSKFKSLASILIPLLLGLGLTVYSYYSFTPSQLQQMKSYFLQANYNFIGLSLAIAIAGYVLRAYRWKYTLEQIGVKPEFRLNFLAVSIGYFVNLTIPRSGEVSRALILTRYRGVPFDKAFGTIIAERMVDFVILLLFIFTAVAAEYDTLRDFLMARIPFRLLAMLLAIGFAGMVVSFYLYLKSSWKPVILLKSKISGLKEGATSIFRLPNKWIFLFQTLLIWFSYVLMFYCATFALEETSGISFGAILIAFVIGSLVITFTNGGFGFFPPLVAAILVLYHVPGPAGIAFGWIVWTSQLGITVFLGIFGFLTLPLLRKSNKVVT